MALLSKLPTHMWSQLPQEPEPHGSQLPLLSAGGVGQVHDCRAAFQPYQGLALALTGRASIASRKRVRISTAAA